jgi:hypothetical protein
MKIFFASLTAASIAVMSAACAAPTESNDATNDTASEDLKTASLSGTYTINGKTDLTPYNSIVLSSNHTFTAEGGCRQDGPGPHCFAITHFSGSWKIVKSGPQLGAPGGVDQIQFTDSFKNVSTFFYSLANDQLVLTETFKGKATTFDRDLSKLPKLHSGSLCADKDNNTLGICPDDLPCEYDGPTGNVQRCLPPI